MRQLQFCKELSELFWINNQHINSVIHCRAVLIFLSPNRKCYRFDSTVFWGSDFRPFQALVRYLCSDADRASYSWSYHPLDPIPQQNGPWARRWIEASSPWVWATLWIKA
jgi:hypothetical protein